MSSPPTPQTAVLSPVRFDILTLFPEVFGPYLGASILGRAIAKGLIQVQLHQIRDYAEGKHRTVDDVPYGGGAGMVMRCEPLYRCWQAAQAAATGKAQTILLSPQGKPFSQALFAQKAAHPANARYILVCGRYEGIDERFIELCVDEELSLGDFVLSGGELPALALIDGIMRLLPGALGNESSLDTESFSQQTLLEHAHYTRPPEFQSLRVPEVLQSGNHKEIAAWRLKSAQEHTKRKRPDLSFPK